MGFTSDTAREAGKKSKRGKAKHSSELRAKLSELTDELIGHYKNRKPKPDRTYRTTAYTSDIYDTKTQARAD
jgi:hypothetical protein